MTHGHHSQNGRAVVRVPRPAPLPACLSTPPDRGEALCGVAELSLGPVPGDRRPLTLAGVKQDTGEASVDGGCSRMNSLWGWDLWGEQGIRGWVSELVWDTSA